MATGVDCKNYSHCSLSESVAQTLAREEALLPGAPRRIHREKKHGSAQALWETPTYRPAGSTL